MNENSADYSVLRILDASINRAGEGFRVVEAYVRMELNDAHLSKQLKQLRHNLTTAVASIDPAERVAARDSVADVGRTIQTESEYDRSGSKEDGEAPEFGSGMVRANLARAQQALRTIEEFSKTLDRDMAKQVEQIRYQTYTIEKAVLTTVVSLQNLAESNLYVLIDGCGNVETLQEKIRQLIDASVNLIQLRDKSLNDREMVRYGNAISSLTRGTKTRFIMNDRADLAVAAKADGVHLGQEDVLVGDARKIVGAARMIGVSTHTVDQARQAVLDGANYIGVGPVFDTTTKQFDSLAGLEFVKAVASEVTLPAFAIGGINLDNVDQIVANGLNRIAVLGAVTRADNPKDVILKLKNKLAAK